MKITVDTLVQQDIVDGFRGRVFALYDMLFNLALVAAATVTAIALPQDGHSPAAVLVIAAAWTITGVGYLRRSRCTSP